MQLSKESIEEYKEIHKKDTGKELSDQEALDMATNLSMAFEVVYKPIPKDKKKECKKICQEQKKK